MTFRRFTVDGIVRDNGDTDKGMADRAKQLDDSLTWVWRTDRFNPSDELLWWPGLEQRIVDFHARYERACIED
jgi:hypothetical protein